jgi:hypothetical protein
MKCHVNGLKKLIMEESPSAYYVHCFVHQLQLTLVVVAKENIDLSRVFWATCIFVECSRDVLQEGPHASHTSS